MFLNIHKWYIIQIILQLAFLLSTALILSFRIPFYEYTTIYLSIPYWWVVRRSPFLYSYKQCYRKARPHLHGWTLEEFGRNDPRRGLQSVHIFALSDCSPKWLYQLILSPAEYERLLYSTSSQILSIMRFLNVCQSDGYERETCSFQTACHVRIIMSS